ncbi:hypothetical protein SAMN05444166_5513 [Singulisphaera sp. GP187]|uniref:hypothetical protein n=1 Tax=Singulisphaera sp. GP187 TaxID=1882752 RepID=UPI00092A5400|nr:hypothetical protein [Singulisphaera sp. GP187]SIO57880.1 hypothetical protein SAMN05444166_5513 [Singulisphaera sp. GP187]
MGDYPKLGLFTAEERKELGLFLACLLAHLDYRCSVASLRLQLQNIARILESWNGNPPAVDRALSAAEYNRFAGEAELLAKCLREIASINGILRYGGIGNPLIFDILFSLTNDPHVQLSCSFFSTSKKGPWMHHANYFHDLNNGSNSLALPVYLFKRQLAIGKSLNEIWDHSDLVANVREMLELLSRAESHVGPLVDDYRRDIRAALATTPFRGDIAPWLDRMVSEGVANGSLIEDQANEYRQAAAECDCSGTQDPWVVELVSRLCALDKSVPTDKLFEWLTRTGRIYEIIERGMQRGHS